jgi:hypothetical protein
MKTKETNNSKVTWKSSLFTCFGFPLHSNWSNKNTFIHLYVGFVKNTSLGQGTKMPCSTPMKKNA